MNGSKRQNTRNPDLEDDTISLLPFQNDLRETIKMIDNIGYFADCPT